VLIYGKYRTNDFGISYLEKFEGHKITHANKLINKYLFFVLNNMQ